MPQSLHYDNNSWDVGVFLCVCVFTYRIILVRCIKTDLVVTYYSLDSFTLQILKSGGQVCPKPPFLFIPFATNLTWDFKLQSHKHILYLPLFWMQDIKTCNSQRIAFEEITVWWERQTSWQIITPHMQHLLRKRHTPIAWRNRYMNKSKPWHH